MITNLTSRCWELPQWLLSWLRECEFLVSLFLVTRQHEHWAALNKVLFHYVICFRTLVAKSRWNDETLSDMFISVRVSRPLATVDLLRNFKALAELAIKISHQLCNHE